MALLLGSGLLELVAWATFRIVGIELGANEGVASSIHLAKRLPQALIGGRRFVALDVPAVFASHLWKVAILPRALYACEIRHISPQQLTPSTTESRHVVRKAPLAPYCFAASEVIHGPLLGTCAAQNPRLGVLIRRLKWAFLLYNTPGLVGTVDCALTTSSDTQWNEPYALWLLLDEVHRTVERNLHSVQAPRSSYLDPESCYGGPVLSEDPVPANTVWTDGSMAAAGASAAFQAAGHTLSCPSSEGLDSLRACRTLLSGPVL